MLNLTENRNKFGTTFSFMTTHSKQRRAVGRVVRDRSCMYLRSDSTKSWVAQSQKAPSLSDTRKPEDAFRAVLLCDNVTHEVREFLSIARHFKHTVEQAKDLKSSTERAIFDRIKRHIVQLCQLCIQESIKNEDTKKNLSSFSLSSSSSFSSSSKDSNLSISTVNMYLTSLNKHGAKLFAQRLICDTGVLESIMTMIQKSMELLRSSTHRTTQLKFRHLNRRMSAASSYERGPKVIIQALYHFVGAVVVNSTWVSLDFFSLMRYDLYISLSPLSITSLSLSLFHHILKHTHTHTHTYQLL